MTATTKTERVRGSGVETRMWNDIEFRILDTGETIVPVEGHAVVYGQWYDVYDGGPGGKFREVMLPGSTRDVAKSDDVIFDVNHAGIALGRTGSAGTLTLTETTRGLHFRWLADSRSSAHTDTLLAIQRGDLRACSVAMGSLSDKWNAGMSERQVLKIGKLYGLGPVNHPASPTTDVALAERGIFRAQFIPDKGSSPRSTHRTTFDLRDEVAAMRARSKPHRTTTTQLKAELVALRTAARAADRATANLRASAAAQAEREAEDLKRRRLAVLALAADAHFRGFGR